MTIAFKQILLTSNKPAILILLLLAFAQCQNEELIEPAIEPKEDLDIRSASAESCSTCTYIIPSNTHVIDGRALNIKPGAIIGLRSSNSYKNIVFRNIVGTATQPIIIKNCDGTALINGTGMTFGLKFENSKCFKLSGGNAPGVYGIKVIGSHNSVQLEKLSNEFEVDHLDISGSGFAGVMAKTDPTCDDATIRGNFTMTNVKIHDNYVHDTKGEGLYIGNSFYARGRVLSCGTRLPHEIHNLQVYNNIVKNTGWDGIQIGSATKGALVYGNKIENYGMLNSKNHNNGVQLGEGTGGYFYNNSILTGSGVGLMILGLGDNVVHNNIIVKAGSFGIFCDERFTPGPGFQFLNNTIVNPKSDGIRIYSEKLPNNVIVNNIIVNPGSFSTYSYPRTSQDSYIYKLSKTMNVTISNNLLTRDVNAPKFVSALANNFRLSSTSPAVNKGKSISNYNITRDFYNESRLKGTTYDIGASEY